MIRRLALAALVALWPALACAQFATIGPTPAVSDNGDRLATTAWVNSFVNAGLPLAAGNIWIGSAGGIATPQTPSGDLTMSNGGAFTLATVNSNVGSFGSASQCATIAVNAKGLITAISATACTGFTPAAKSDQQTGTSNTLGITPLHQQDHDSAAKAWATWTGSTGALTSNYNVSSVTRSGAGIYIVNFTTAFASANYSCALGTNASGQLFTTVELNTYTTTSVTAVFIIGSTATDPSIGGGIQCYGRQ